ncbi:CoA transferase [Mycolicibacterium stellerae]|uniref:CoA transferase n=1 Tax=Mycolicibacterium stellerae TaxID=2358193 RepID=UPI000F0B11BA|nr:CoA transferase [Mycolicibacterium stellerae]
MQNGVVGSLGIPDAVFARARRVADGIGRSAADLGGAVSVDADELLTGRAGLLRLAPAGRISAGGSTRLLATRDGWCAVTLSRADDIEAVPALLELAEQPTDVWAALAAAAAVRAADEFVARARMLDLPAAVLGEVDSTPTRFVPTWHCAARAVPELLVADLSSMWAGPLCGRLLAAAGATVVKVEGRGRPDGTRQGDPRFFDWMNAAKLSYAIDFRDDDLRPLLAAADVVIEGSRPAALIRRGLGPDQVRGRDGRIWLRITGYGTEGERADRVAFGDDAAVAGGLVGDGVEFIGDAIADPLTGLAATRAVLDSLGRGGGEIVETALAGVAADYAALPLTDGSKSAEPPRIPDPPQVHAPELGADNRRVRELIEARLATC